MVFSFVGVGETRLDCRLGLFGCMGMGDANEQHGAGWIGSWPTCSGILVDREGAFPGCGVGVGVVASMRYGHGSGVSRGASSQFIAIRGVSVDLFRFTV